MGSFPAVEGWLLELVSHSAEETQGIGRKLGELAQAGDVLLLVGELGVGKTCLTQGLAWGLGIGEYAISPSFVLVREYQGRFPLYHIDFYRLNRIEEIVELGLEDVLYGRGVYVVEWAEKGLEVLPEEHLLIRMWYANDGERKLRMEPEGERYRLMLAQLRESLPGILESNGAKGTRH